MQKLKLALEKIISIIGGLCLITIFLVMMAQIAARYVFNSPLPWPEELSLFLMAPLTFIGAYLAIIHDEHLNITFLLEKAKPGLRQAMMVFDRLVVIIFLFAVIYYGYDFLLTAGQLTTAVMAIPMWAVYGTMWVCCLLMLLESLIQIVSILRRQPVEKEVTQ